MTHKIVVRWAVPLWPADGARLTGPNCMSRDERPAYGLDTTTYLVNNASHSQTDLSKYYDDYYAIPNVRSMRSLFPCAFIPS